MKPHTFIPSVFVVLAAAAITHGQVLDPPVPGRAIMRAQPGVSIEEAIAYVQPMLPDVTFTVDDNTLAARDIYLLFFEPAEMGPQVEVVLGSLKTDPLNQTSQWGELLYAGHDPEGNTGSIWFNTIGGVEAFNNQYADAMLGLGPAHGQSTGQGTVVAVLDTGVDATHPLLAGAIAPGGYNFVNGSTNTADTGDGIDSDGDMIPDESVGHGTFVAGLIHLVAPDATVLPVVVLDSDGMGDGWLFVRGIYHAIDRGVEVINLSLGSTYNSDAVADAIEEARQLGIIVTAAGGNNDAGEETLEEFPASRNNVFGVSAVDAFDVKAAFSNYHSNFFISAPGASVEDPGAPDGYDPNLTIYGTVPGGDFGIWQGTSFATAFVSGAAALVRAQHPEWAAAESTWDLIESVLASSAVNIDAQNPGYLGQLGVGRLDAAAAAMLGPVAPTPGDLDNDGVVGVKDMLRLLAEWGLVHSSADLNGDGAVGIEDFITLLGNWG